MLGADAEMLPIGTTESSYIRADIVAGIVAIRHHEALVPMSHELQEKSIGKLLAHIRCMPDGLKLVLHPRFSAYHSLGEIMNDAGVWRLASTKRCRMPCSSYISPSFCYTHMLYKHPHRPHRTVLNRWYQALWAAGPFTVSAGHRQAGCTRDSHLGTALNAVLATSSYAAIYTLRQALLAILSERGSSSCNTMRIADSCGDMQGSYTHQ